MTASATVSNTTKKKRPRLEVNVDKSFRYYPHGLTAPRRMGEWIVGPTFIVRGAYEQLEGFSGTDPSWQIEATRLLSGNKRHLRPVVLAPDGHKRKPLYKVGQYGEQILKRAEGSCTARLLLSGTTPVAELAYPLVQLAKAVGATEFKLARAVPAQAHRVYGFNKDGTLTCILATREVADDCFV